MLRDAIAEGEAQRAGSLMVEHIMQGRDALLALQHNQSHDTQTHAS
jgi:DNA-binding GntR family transcriptional regulator